MICDGLFPGLKPCKCLYQPEKSAMREATEEVDCRNRGESKEKVQQKH